MKNLQKRTKIFLSLSLLLFFLLSNNSITKAQDQNATNIDRYYEYESMTDPYIHVPESEKVRGPAYAFSTGLFTITQVNVDSLGNNIIGDAANEPSLAIDPTDPNRMAIGWRQFGTTVLSSLYYASSFDGGLTWTENERLSDAFDPHLGWPNQNKIGDYNHMISDEEGAHLAWAATFNGEQDVYYSFIEAEVPLSGVADLGTGAAEGLTVSVYPNPIEAETTLSIFSKSAQHITLTLHDLLGRPLGVLAEKHFSSGNSELLWAPKGLMAGTYFLRAEGEDGERSIAKVVVIE